MDFDLIIRNGTIVTASDILPSTDIGVKNGTIICLAPTNFLTASPNTRIIDAAGAYVTPGGIDSHAHIDQGDAVVGPAGDDWDSGTRSAVAGGTTTVLAFAYQARGRDSLKPVVQGYHAKASGKAWCDYGFHVIVTDPTKRVVDEDLAWLVEEQGISSIKLYMTYEPLRVGDREILDLMMRTRALGMTTMIHAENADVIDWISERLEQKGLTQPWYHGVSHPKIAEDEATYRAISLAELMDTPILLVHMSSRLAVSHVRKAQTRLLPIHAETCPQYLFLTQDNMVSGSCCRTSRSSDPETFEGAKFVCSPPLRSDPMELEAMWTGIANGTFTTFSSDHAPAKYNHPQGKQAGLNASFRQIPNGLPGIETRLALLMEGVLDGKISPQKFVEVTASNPAKLYGLAGKGVIAPGADADFTIWYPQRGMEAFELKNEMLHHAIDYTPYEGMRFRNWPRWTIVRGVVVWDRDGQGLMDGGMGSGKFLKRGKSLLRGSRDIWTNEWRP